MTLELWQRFLPESEKAGYIRFFDGEPEYAVIDTPHHLAETTERTEAAIALQEVFDWIRTATVLAGCTNLVAMENFSDLFNLIMNNVEEAGSSDKLFSATDSNNVYSAPSNLPEMVRERARELVGDRYARIDEEAPFPWTEIAELNECAMYGFDPVGRDVYTYNYENDLSADIQYVLLSDGAMMFALIQLHLGGDARGGLTNPIAVEVLDEYYFQSFNITWSCQQCGKHYDLTYNFLRDEPSYVLSEDVEFDDEYNSATVAFDEVTFSCPKCGAKIWPYVVAEAGF